ncbi:Phospholipid metabolism protein [Friedmanniomyces endolithicus]|uniref:Phospholipid metabolism protein n=3 Tax=Dothideomycetidae TaxID=451867 RepID=A0AAN6R1V3_9PEZI|nr:Phospholipid metabolism protein [Friedmanniomyces endolithicus]KAK5147839.1 Phospholipid metabolism protein [Rachicladosporium monterosium]KAK0817093.1 Phospholipid metabolism protein [Friedmanniomyces endolithicus]KAK0819889.1 Phospholipid metabolism protein [Friedmanniomyces endolithicus]KAK0852815.1 Phospholipid metabolism protein [Friedmanniomyces endolithicus]
MRIFASQHEFAYSWEEVSTNNWRKYCAHNDKASHVLAVDTLSRSLDATTHILRTERLITCRQSMPQWVKRIMGGDDTSYVYEVSYVDPAAKRVTMCSQNMTWSELLQVQEKVVYTPSVEAEGHTRFEQSARIIALCGGWQKIKNSIEEISLERFRQNAAKGREGFERVLEISRQVFAQQREEARQQREGVAADLGIGVDGLL